MSFTLLLVIKDSLRKCAKQAERLVVADLKAQEDVEL
jgi:hypothetical protein